jgi:hypothetical protein
MSVEQKSTVRPCSQREAVHQLLAEAASKEQLDRRSEVRHPFFSPLSITPEDGQHKKFSAFSREISPSGIGLLHNMRIDLGVVTISVHREGGRTVELRTEILWCRACGEGWYLSGGRFVSDDLYTGATL